MDSLLLPDSLKNSLATRATMYNDQLSSGESSIAQAGRDYLESRGLGDPWIIDKYQLGIVAEPHPGDEQFSGRVALPYQTKDGIRGLKFRCIQPHSCKEVGHGKYTQPSGQAQRLYNALHGYFSGMDVIGLCEGEFDAIAATEAIGVPAMGIPGATQWGKNGFYWQLALRDFSRVVVFADGDVPGMELASAILADVPHAQLVKCPEGEDVNSMILAGRGDELKRKAGVA